jgi:hypothetical protein
VLSLPAGRSTTVEYDLVRRAAVQVEGRRMHCRLLLRPQPTVNPDQLEVAVAAPARWRFVQVPDGFAGGRWRCAGRGRSTRSGRSTSCFRR